MLGPMLTLTLATSLAVLVAGGGPLLPPRPLAVVRVPDEPRAIVLPNGAPTLQALAADLDSDGAPEVVRLVGGDNGAAWIEAWADGADGWRLMTAPALAVPGRAGQAELAFVGRPVRLLLRRADGEDRVTLVRQPDFAEPDDPEECCLLLDDLILAGNSIRLAPVADPGPVADTVHAIDLDGDGTDELLVTYFLSPLNDASSLTEARVFRWAEDHFAEPTVTRLPVGSGSTPFILGDSDGIPGDEAGFISSSALDALFRISLGPGDTLITEDSGLIVDDALAVPLSGTRRGVALLAPRLGLVVLPWPRGDPPGVPIAAQPMQRARLIGVVEIGGNPQLLVHRTDPDGLHVRDLPDLVPTVVTEPIRSSQAAATLRNGPLVPYIGPLPGGGLHGEFAAIIDGRLLPAPVLNDPSAPAGAFAGGRPVGLVGRDRAWLATLQGAIGVPVLEPAGGRLDPLNIGPGSVVAIAPLDVVTTPEGNGGAYDPAIQGGVLLADGVIGVNSEGFVAEVRAPPGSHVYLPGQQPETPEVVVVDEDGALDVAVALPGGVTADAAAPVMMTVVTPAGHAYTSSWSLLLVDGPPDIRAQAETTFGSTQVIVAGRAAPYAVVAVGGTVVAVDEEGRFSTSVDLPPWPTAVTVTARDPLGNEADLLVSGVGIVDYRGLPWLPIALVILGGIAVALFVRVPKTRSATRSVGDDAILEEIDPAEPP